MQLRRRHAPGRIALLVDTVQDVPRFFEPVDFDPVDKLVGCSFTLFD